MDWPAVWAPKVEVIHDGIDTERRRRRLMPRRVGGEAVTESTRIVTYMARGLEVMRGFERLCVGG